jgi:hypothetical protein
MPTHRVGREIQQDPIRLKNLLGEAEERLIAAGARPPEARSLLEPAQRLVSDGLFWQRQSDGLAMFISVGLFRLYRLPFDFETLVVVTDRFHLKPLIPVLSGNGRFYVLALSQDEIRLLHGTRHSVSEVELEDAPESLAEALKWNDAEKRFQFHTATRTPGGERVRPAVRAARPAIFHGHGVASADDPKENILRYFHRVDEGLSEVLRGEQAPLVLAGVGYLLPIYRDASAYPHLLDEGIEGNPEELSAKELHERAWTLVRPLFLSAQQEASERYAQLASVGSPQASDDLKQVVPAAHSGRVEMLFVALGRHRWGSFDPDAREVRLHGDRRPGDEDLLDFVAVHTLLNGGAVYAVEAGQVPGGASLAAVFRY